MNQSAIEVKDLTKKFKHWIEKPTSVKSILVNLTRGRIDRARFEEVTCFQDLNFKIHQGEFVGILGRNGAGKSTLLKLISGIYTPTSGSIQVNGAIAPLIELGAGFHRDLTGYENIFLNASILGFGRREILKALPEILEFAEFGDRIHLPVRNYSSGMLVRLGFSIATHIAAPILLVDEVLAVGDLAFQKKCLKKIHDLHAQGRTIVLISHDLDTVVRHCSRCIVIDQSQMVYDGPTSEAVKAYFQVLGNDFS